MASRRFQNGGRHAVHAIVEALILVMNLIMIKIHYYQSSE